MGLLPARCRSDGLCSAHIALRDPAKVSAAAQREAHPGVCGRDKGGTEPGGGGGEMQILLCGAKGQA